MEKTKVLLDSSEWYEMAIEDSIYMEIEEREENGESFTEDELKELKEELKEKYASQYVETEHIANMEISESESFLERLVSNYEERYGTEVSYLAWVGTRSSHYGAIGGNGSSCVGVRPYGDGSGIVFGDNTRLVLSIEDDNNGVILEVSDHDGTNHTKLVIITESMIAKSKKAWESDFEVAEEIAKSKTPYKVTKKVFNELY